MNANGWNEEKSSIALSLAISLRNMFLNVVRQLYSLGYTYEHRTHLYILLLNYRLAHDVRNGLLSQTFSHRDVSFFVCCCCPFATTLRMHMHYRGSKPHTLNTCFFCFHSAFGRRQLTMLHTFDYKTASHGKRSAASTSRHFTY